MRRLPFARGLLWAALFSTALPALAAKPRPKKPANTSAASKTKAKAEAEKPAAVEEAPAPAAAEEPAPAAKPVEPEPANDAPAKAPEAVPTVTAVAAAEPEREDDEVTRLGRREAARIAAGRTQVAVWLSAGVANRRFSYSDAVGDELAPYSLPAAPMASIGLEAYPAASSDLTFFRDLGLRGHVSRGFAFDSNTPQGVSLETSWTRFGGELRWRLLVPGAHAFELGVLAGADASYFGMTASEAVPALLPAARTVSLRFGCDTKLRVAWRLSVLLGGAYLLTTSRGDVYANFRDPRVAGVDGDLGFAVNLGSGLELLLAGRYTRYFAKFEPQLGDRYVAGGALDEQLQLSLGVRYAH